MLVRLYGKNFRSLKASFELSLVAADLKRGDDRGRGVIETVLTGMADPLRLLRAVAIFGSNASGKSTVLTAGRALRWLATRSSYSAKPDGDIQPYEPFVLDEATRASPIELGCDVVHDGSLLRYEVVYTRKAIMHETLRVINDGENDLLIDRHHSEQIAGQLLKQSDANRLYVKEMQPNVTVLSKLAQHGPSRGRESAQPYFLAIRRALNYEDYSPAASGIRVGPVEDRFADDAEYRTWIMRHLMRAADVGICDVNTRRVALDVPEPLRELVTKLGNTAEQITIPEKTVEVSFVHSGLSKQQVTFSGESAGTRKLFNISNDWWRLANESITLLADELGASLHPRLMDRLVRAVNDAPPTSVRSQLVFTAHETGLLESRDGLPPALRRDQVYFTRKDENGASELYSLAEFKEGARPVHNIRKRYLSGLYGAIPSVEKLSL